MPSVEWSGREKSVFVPFGAHRDIVIFYLKYFQTGWHEESVQASPQQPVFIAT